MNKEFRLGIYFNRKGIQRVFDYTPYDKKYSEPQELGQRNWSIMGLINQKRTRKQDKPVKLKKWSIWSK